MATFPTANALLAVWDRPWSQNAIRFAAHRLTTAHDAGLDVLEAKRSRYAYFENFVAFVESPHSERCLINARAVMLAISPLTGAPAEDVL